METVRNERIKKNETKKIIEKKVKIYHIFLTCT